MSPDGDGDPLEPTPGFIYEDVVFNIEDLHKHDPRLWNQTHPHWASELAVVLVRGSVS